MEFFKKHGQKFDLPLSDNIMQEFREFLDSLGFVLPNLIQSSFEEFTEALEETGHAGQYADILGSFEHKIEDTEQNIWAENLESIRKNLGLVMARMAFSKAERYQKYDLRYDTVIARAREILANKAEYDSILSGEY